MTNPVPTKFWRTKYGYEPADWPLPTEDTAVPQERVKMRPIKSDYPDALTEEIREVLTQKPGLSIMYIVHELIAMRGLVNPGRGADWPQYHADCFRHGYHPAQVVCALRAGPFKCAWVERDGGGAYGEWEVVR